MIEIYEVKTKKDIDDFTMLPFDLYKAEDNWVPPLISDYKKYITGKTSSVNEVGESIMYLAKKDDKLAGRILVGLNEELNEYHGVKDSYFSQYECIDDPEVSKALFDQASKWAKDHGSNLLKGPMSLPGGDDNRGFLLDNFDEPPMIQNVYNFKYYNDQVLDAGFSKYHDCYAFDGSPDKKVVDRYAKIIPYAMKKYKFRLDKFRLDKDGIKKDALDVSEVIKKGMPNNKDWVDLMPPSREEIDNIVAAAAPLADADFIYIARNEKDEPIAFNIAVPDYNQVLKKMNGKKNPFAILKFLYNKRKINQMRVFVLFVVPEYRNKGVTQAIYFKIMDNAIKKGYKKIEGSTIWDYNMPMLNDILKAGAKISKTYRVYQKEI
ncbi:hypothetical protein [Ezakiella peruensis]|uniref:hypothetical protein n=1 Tax=Ezakiella peruensis TaxID=1464038 RepID=UPI000C1B445D|nr:hypothetical protein [Ezakiella peruensis]